MYRMRKSVKFFSLSCSLCYMYAWKKRQIRCHDLKLLLMSLDLLCVTAQTTQNTRTKRYWLILLFCAFYQSVLGMQEAFAKENVRTYTCQSAVGLKGVYVIVTKWGLSCTSWAWWLKSYSTDCESFFITPLLTGDMNSINWPRSQCVAS